jgi:hypothetical protein
MRKLLRRTACVLCAPALLLMGAIATPAVARGGGGGQGIVDGFYSAGDYGAHFGRDESTHPGGSADHNAGGPQGGQSGGYPGYYGGHNCSPAFDGQNPQICK